MLSCYVRSCVCETQRGFASQEGVGACPPLQRHSTRGLRTVILVCAVPGFCVAGGGWALAPVPPATQHHSFASGVRNVGLCHTADMSAVSRSKHLCCVKQQTCLPCHTADTSAVSHSRHVLPCHTADTSAVSHSRHVCCVTLQTRVPCHTAGMVAVSHGRHVFWVT